MNNFTAKLYNNTNPDINPKDIIRLVDGSALTHDIETCYIVKAYPELTGSKEKLKNLDCTVLETGITDRICIDPFFVKHAEVVYLQDILIQCGNTTFRTNSTMVHKV